MGSSTDSVLVRALVGCATSPSCTTAPSALWSTRKLKTSGSGSGSDQWRVPARTVRSSAVTGPTARCTGSVTIERPSTTVNSRQRWTFVNDENHACA